MPLNPNKILERRKALGLTQRQCADKANIWQSHWAAIESGKRKQPSLDTALQIAKALRCGVRRLMD